MNSSIKEMPQRQMLRQNSREAKLAELANIVTIETGDGRAMVTKIGVFTGVHSHPLS